MTRYIPDDSDVNGGESASRCERCGAIENGQEHCFDDDDALDNELEGDARYFLARTIATPEQRRVLAAHGFDCEAHDGTDQRWREIAARWTR